MNRLRFGDNLRWLCDTKVFLDTTRRLRCPCRSLLAGKSRLDDRSEASSFTKAEKQEEML